MKKIILLFTMICAGQLYGMENPKPNYMASLPKEVQGLIIIALQTGNDLDGTIRDIKATSLTNKALNQIVNEMYGNQKGFTALVHMLADKFNITTEEVIQKFGNTPASNKYIKLLRELYEALQNDDIAKAKQTIEQCADVNYSWGSNLDPASLLLDYVRISQNNPTLVKLLLDAGANPNLYKNIMEASNNALAYKGNTKYEKDAQDIRALLEEAMKKQQQ